ncbi:hypothetical protein Ae201684P_005942 [Aphanomyces euteiches]|nr:hypothetical protein Ae201684P_005942 [Aphanomyces euteiches]
MTTLCAKRETSMTVTFLQSLRDIQRVERRKIDPSALSGVNSVIERRRMETNARLEVSTAIDSTIDDARPAQNNNSENDRLKEETQRGKLDDILVGTTTMSDRSEYHGQLNKDRVPHGVGSMYFVAGGFYSGEYVNGKRHGLGVYSFPDGSRYEGEFKMDLRDGHGVYMVPVGEKYRGQWKLNAHHGLGEFTSWNGEIVRGEFKLNDLIDAESQQKAILAEREARTQELFANAQDSLSINGVFIKDEAAFEAYEQATSARQRELAAMWQKDFDAMETSTQEGKTEEATLGEDQKQILALIEVRRAELARYSQYCDIAIEKEKTLAEARRILASIEKQIELEKSVDASGKPAISPANAEVPNHSLVEPSPSTAI